MRRGITPLQILLIIVSVGGALAVALLVYHRLLPDSVGRFRNIIAWGVFCGIAAVGVTLTAKKTDGR